MIPSTPTLTDPPWRPEVLSRLGEQLGDDAGVMLGEIVQLYLRQSRETLHQMEAAAVVGEADQLRSLAHCLKGSTATVGGARLAAVCQDIELGRQQGPELPELVWVVRQEFDVLATLLEGSIPTRGGLR